MRWSLALLLAASCGRIGFTSSDAAMVDAGVPHVQTASGWTARVLVDLSGVIPYNANDFFDGGMFELDNAPDEVASLYPPFPSLFAGAPAARSSRSVRTSRSRCTTIGRKRPT